MELIVAKYLGYNRHSRPFALGAKGEHIEAYESGMPCAWCRSEHNPFLVWFPQEERIRTICAEHIDFTNTLEETRRWVLSTYGEASYIANYEGSVFGKAGRWMGAARAHLHDERFVGTRKQALLLLRDKALAMTQSLKISPVVGENVHFQMRYSDDFFYHVYEDSAYYLLFQGSRSWYVGLAEFHGTHMTVAS